MKDMLTYVVTNGDEPQSNYEKLKTNNSFIWSVPNSAASKLIPNTEWLIINPKKKEMFLAKILRYLTAEPGSNSNTTKVDAIEILGDFSGRTFIQSEIIEELKLSENFLIPHLSVGRGSTVFNLGQQGKTRIIAVRNALKKECENNTKIYEYLHEDIEEEDDCIAYKEGNKWGFLFYKIKKDKNEFKFEPVDNTDLRQTDEGYKDFVYFIFSQGHPQSIKIGRSDNPSKRFRSLDGSNPATIRLLLVLPDGRKEKMYHQMFENYKIYGKLEWFWDDPEIRKFIKEEEMKYQKIKKLYTSKCPN